MRVIAGLWRWRRNPLRRTTDLTEGWATLVAALLLLLAAPAAGWLCGALLDSSLQQTVRAQHAERYPVTAVIAALPKDRRPAGFDGDSPKERSADTRVIATWRAVDGSKHKSAVSAPLSGWRTGDSFRIWTDAHGTQVKPPMDAETARLHAALAGTGAALAAGLLIEGGRRLFVRRLVLLRHRRLDRAWAEVGPDWGRTGAGS